MNKSAGELLGSVLKRSMAQKKYKEEVYEPKPKTKQSKGTRVDKRTFNKGRPKKTVPVLSPTGKDIIPVMTPEPPKKGLTVRPRGQLNQIEKLAGYIIGGYLRSKLDAMDMQPAIYSDLIGKDIKDKLDKGVPINFNTVVANAKSGGRGRGRPKGAKDKVPRKKKDA
jgi:hypothetical protein